jgi:hypothetical protein
MLDFTTANGLIKRNIRREALAPAGWHESSDLRNFRQQEVSASLGEKAC